VCDIVVKKVTFAISSSDEFLSPISHTADNFASFFVGKVSDIRSATSAAPPAVIVPRKTPPFSRFDMVATDEVIDLLTKVTKVPSKTCQLDPNSDVATEATVRHVSCSHCVSVSKRARQETGDRTSSSKEADA